MKMLIKDFQADLWPSHLREENKIINIGFTRVFSDTSGAFKVRFLVFNFRLFTLKKFIFPSNNLLELLVEMDALRSDYSLCQQGLNEFWLKLVVNNSCMDLVAFHCVWTEKSNKLF